MAENNNIKDFTAADIEKYWSGKLSTAEMHALEKAAMDDPFLADALEGYQYRASSSNDDIAILKEKLATKIGVAPVINMKKKRFAWIRVAAAVVIIAGTGLILQQYVFDKKEQSIAVTSENQKEQPSTPPNKSVADTIKQNTGSTVESFKVDPLQANPSTDQSANAEEKNLSSQIKDVKSTPDSKQLLDEQAETVVSSSALSRKEEDKKGVTAAGDVIGNTKTDSVAIRQNYAVENKRNQIEKPASRAKATDGLIRSDDKYYNRSNFLNNSYSYRVVDPQNNPVPFANVFNTRDNIGTYTDAKGNFNLLSSDSTMDVQIRSLGYNSGNYRLVPSIQQNELVLKEDEETRRQITAQNRKMVSSVIRKDSTELEEPEVGWGNYNTYIANNIQIPDNLRARNNTRNDVELSFDVDRNGNPTNIKIARSSQCKACDEEAIRLLREGPKWKRKGKKNKTTISIAVDQ